HLDPSGSGLEISREGLSAWRATAAALYIPTWSSLIADAALSVGDVDAAAALATDALAMAEANGDVISLADLQRLQADVAARRGDSEGAKHFLEAAMVTARKQRAHLFGVRAANSLARILIAAGNAEDARKVLESALDTFTQADEF